MTIDEAIKDFKDDAENNRVDLDLEFAKKNEQIAEWLEELKAMRNLDKTNFSDGYSMAIDDVISMLNNIKLDIYSKEILSAVNATISLIVANVKQLKRYGFLEGNRNG